MTDRSLLAGEGTVLVVGGPAGRLLGLTGGLQDLLEVLDILHRLVEDVHFGHFLDHGSSWHMSPQGLEASIDRLDSVPLSLVPLDGLDVLLRLDGVAVYGMNGHELGPGRHVCPVCCVCWSGDD